MSRCLSERTLLRLFSGGGRASQRAHLETCDRCGARYREITLDLDAVADVLRRTAPPRRSPATVRRYWVPASAVGVAAVALLVWVEIAMWHAATRMAPPQEEVTAFITDVSATMFSTRDPARALPAGLSPIGEVSSGCSSDPVGILGCETDEDEQGR